MFLWSSSIPQFPPYKHPLPAGNISEAAKVHHHYTRVSAQYHHTLPGTRENLQEIVYGNIKIYQILPIYAIFNLLCFWYFGCLSVRFTAAILPIN